MLKNVLFLINIPKLQRLLNFCGEISLYFSAIFVGEVQGLVLFSGARYPRYATNTHTTGF